MPEPRAQRTLVKSPPEIWAEVSDVSTLARHLGEFGEIRITRLEAETTVVWEGDRARGTVELEASGWGTKVTITAEAIATDGAEVVEAEEKDAAPAEAVGPEEPVAVEVEAIEAAVAAPEPEPEPIEAEVVDAEPVEAEVVDAEPVEAEVVETAAAEAEEAHAEPEPTAAAEPVSQELARAPRRGFFARLLRRRAAPAMAEPLAVETPQATEPEPTVAEPTAAEPEPEPVAISEPEPVAIEPEIVPTVAAPEPEAAEIPEAVDVPEAPAIAEPDLDGEIAASATAATAALEPEQVEAVLVGVLDDLGSAHHRPFSRG